MLDVLEHQRCFSYTSGADQTKHLGLPFYCVMHIALELPATQRLAVVSVLPVSSGCP